MTLQPPKPWYTSLTLWAIVAAVVARLLELMHVRLDPAATGDLASLLLDAAQLAAAASAAYGRLRARQRIGTPTET